MVEGVLRLTAEGEFRFRDEPIRHPRLRAWLHRQLRRTEEGDYWVVNGPQRVRVEIEDTPFVVRHVHPLATEDLELELADGRREPLSEAGLQLRTDGHLLAEVRVGEAGAPAGRGHPARLLRGAVHDLQAWLTETSDGYRLVRGRRHWPVRTA